MPSSRYYRFKTHQSEEKQKFRKNVFFWLIFLAALVLIAWIFFAAPIFKIAEIKMPDNDLVSENDVRKLIANGAPFNFGKNFFILSGERLKLSLAAAFPAITDINIQKEPFQTLIINFSKRTPIGIWCRLLNDPAENNEDCYYFDGKGVIFKKTPRTEGVLILKIVSQKQGAVFLGDRVLTDDILEFIISFNKKITDSGILNIVEFKFDSDSNPLLLKAKTNRGWFVYLDRSQNPILEAENLITVLNETIKDAAAHLEYVDLRVPNRVFYKLK